MISNIYVLDFKGKIIISRDYRGDVSENCIEGFQMKLVDGDDFEPIFEIDGIHYCFVKHENLFFLAVTRRNIDAMLVIMLLNKIIEVLKDYFNVVEEETIRDNFVTTYELFDEMVDFGYPQFTVSNVLKQFITQEGFKKDIAPETITADMTGNMSWRKRGISHNPDEVFLDVIEEVSMLVSTTGAVLNTDILGRVHMNSKLSGWPTLKLGLNDRVSLGSSGIRKSSSRRVQDVSFHECVSLSQFDKNGEIRFVPPDGEFDLLSYRLSTNIRPILLVEAVLDDSSRTKFEILVKVRADFRENFSANNVIVTIPVPKFASQPDFRKSTGKVEYDAENDAAVWKIRQFPGGKEYLLRARFSLPSITTEEEKMKRAPISLQFEIPYFTVSGLQVKYLKIDEPTLRYNAMPWVRYLTKAGEYQIRI